MSSVGFVRLGDVCTKIGSGATPRGGRLTYSDDGPYALVRSQNVLNNAFSQVGLVRISAVQAGQLDGVELREGDVLMNITGDSVARVCQVDSIAIPGRVSQHVAIIRPEPSRLDPRYLRCYLTSSTMQSRLLSLASAGATRNALTKSTVAALQIPAPPLSEQQRIAGILATWDSAIAKTERLIHAKRVEWIAMARAELKAAVGRTVHLGDLCNVSKGMGLSKSDIKPDGAYPCILYGELHTVYGEVVGHIRSRTDALTSTRSQSGDVLIPSSSETSEDLAKASALNEDGVLLGGDINIVRPKRAGSYSSDYLAYYLTHAKGRDIARLAQGNSVVHLYGRDIARLELDLPDLSRQQRVASALNIGKREIDVLDTIRTKYVLQRRAVEQILFAPSCTSGQRAAAGAIR
jgi:type I restriction enzyme S subunit